MKALLLIFAVAVGAVVGALDAHLYHERRADEAEARFFANAAAEQF